MFKKNRLSCADEEDDDIEGRDEKENTWSKTFFC
jgi:hypothetical protein